MEQLGGVGEQVPPALNCRREGQSMPGRPRAASEQVPHVEEGVPAFWQRDLRVVGINVKKRRYSIKLMVFN